MNTRTTTLKTTVITKELIVDIITYLFMVLWLYAATNKLVDYEKFRVQLGQSPMLTEFAPFVAWFIPLAEIILAILLYFSKTRLYGLYASFSLMIMFSAYIIAIKNFSEFVPCSCGGILEKMGWNEHLIFNIGFVVLGTIGVFFQKDLMYKILNDGKPVKE